MSYKIQILLALLAQTCYLYSQNDIVKQQQVYKTIHENNLTVDIFRSPENGDNENKPAIAFFHGGGWAFGEPEQFHNACRRYTKKGFVTFSFQYRLSVKENGTVPHPEITPVESVKDARSALRWLKENSTDLNIDSNKIIVSGQSAGGQLALSTGLCNRVNESTDNLNIDPTPAAFLIYSGTVNTVEAWADRLLADRRQEIWSISPFHNLKAGMPPVIHFHSKDDPVVHYWSVEFFMFQSRKLGNHFELITYEDRQHYLGKDNDLYSSYFDEKILIRTDKFLEKIGLMPN